MGCNCGKRRSPMAVTSVNQAAMSPQQAAQNAIANARGIADEPEPDLTPASTPASQDEK